MKRRAVLAVCLSCLVAACTPLRPDEIGEQASASKRIAPKASRDAIIFRMDDVAQGEREDIVQRIISLFEAQGVPLDVGVMPFTDGHDSFRLPLIKHYRDLGVIDISMHGYRNSYREFDSAHSGLSYAQLYANLVRARQEFQDYYGVAPVAFTVPYDFFDRTGYRAIRDAGFRVFSTQDLIEPHPSVHPVDFSGRPDSHGMWRLSTTSDVTKWDVLQQQWGEVYPAKPNSLLFKNVKRQLLELGVAVISIHPRAFENAEGQPDRDKLAGLAQIIRFTKTLGRITTFARLYTRGGFQPGSGTFSNSPETR